LSAGAPRAHESVILRNPSGIASTRQTTMDDFGGEDLLFLIAGSLCLAFYLAAWLRRRFAPRRQMRKLMGLGAIFGAAALVLVD
jgi:uncharacterized membrane protein YadS